MKIKAPLTGLVLLCAMLFASVTGANAAEKAKKPERVSVMWVGNSYTFFNDLPSLVGHLMAEAGLTYQQGQFLMGGRSLLDHWCHNQGKPGTREKGTKQEQIDKRKGKADALLKEREWKGVVFQGMSREALLPPEEGGPEEFVATAKLWGAHVRKMQPKARLYFYETWARQATPEDQPTITKMYRAAAAAVGGTVVPVGTVWERVRKEKPELVLHTKDGSHPNPTGSYLNALVFYAVITGRDPVGLPGRFSFPSTTEAHPGDAVQVRVDDALARYFQETVREVVLGKK